MTVLKIRSKSRELKCTVTAQRVRTAGETGLGQRTNQTQSLSLSHDENKTHDTLMKYKKVAYVVLFEDN